MFVLIAQRRHDNRTIALATARTRRAIQKKWKAWEVARFNHCWEYMGVLTEHGLTNFHGDLLSSEALKGGGNGRVVVKMGVDYD
jgi:hypothetical protein